MDCIVRGVAKSRTRLSDFHFHCLTSLVTHPCDGDLDSLAETRGFLPPGPGPEENSALRDEVTTEPHLEGVGLSIVLLMVTRSSPSHPCAPPPCPWVHFLAFDPD